jgi:hypothetical protein
MNSQNNVNSDICLHVIRDCNFLWSNSRQFEYNCIVTHVISKVLTKYNCQYGVLSVKEPNCYKF